MKDRVRKLNWILIMSGHGMLESLLELSLDVQLWNVAEPSFRFDKFSLPHQGGLGVEKGFS